jgi:hypothetical protein
MKKNENFLIFFNFFCFFLVETLKIDVTKPCFVPPLAIKLTPITQNAYLTLSCRLKYVYVFGQNIMKKEVLK